MVLLHGTVTPWNDEGSLLLRSDTGPWREMVLHMGPNTLVINATTGWPAPAPTCGPVIAAIGDAVAMSLPPQATAEVLLTNLPHDPPTLLRLERPLDLPEGAEIFPFRTRQIVTEADLTPGSLVLVWPGNRRVMKIF